MSAEMLGKGRRLGRYILKRPLGAGGNGQVFLAWKLNATGEPLPCVVKLSYSRDAKNEQAGRRSIKEATLAMRLGTHPNIVQVIDVDVFEEMPFIVMEYIDGADLDLVLDAARRRGKGLSLLAIYEILAGVATGLHHAHYGATREGQRVGIVHRDIKPANLLITRDGVTKIADFGIGVTLEDGTTGQYIRGTSRYMSAEHLRCDVRPEMDIYSLGVMAWEMVENRVYREECRGMEHYPRILDGDFPPMTNPEAPKQLVALIEACLDPNPQQRPKASDFLKGLSRCPGYTRDPKHVVQEIEAVLGTRRSSGASQQELAATPELIATFAVLGHPWATDQPATPEPPKPEPDDNDSDCVTVARPAQPIIGGRLVEASSGGAVEPESAESERVAPEPTVMEAEPDAPKVFRRPWANRVREISKTVELRPSVGVPADAQADRIKTPPVVVALGEDEESAVPIAAVAEGNTAPGSVGGVEESPPSADVEARPIADNEARASEGAKAPSALRSLLVPVVVSLAASVVAAAVTAQQLGGRDDEPRAMAPATPMVAARETSLAAEPGPSVAMVAEPEASSIPARGPAASATEDALASSITPASPMEWSAEHPTPLPPSEANSDAVPEQQIPAAVPEQPDAPAASTASPPPTSEPSPAPAKPSPPATLTLTLFLLDTAEVQVGRKTTQVSRRTEIEVPAGTHRVRWRLPGEDYWRDAGRKKFAAGHSYLVRVRASTVPEIIDAKGGSR